MNPRDEDYELVARYLDGEQLTLTPAQRELADEVVADTGLVAAALVVPVPSGTLHRANVRMSAALRARRGLRRRLRWAIPAAAAAAVVLAVAVLPWGLEYQTPRVELTAGEYVEQFLKAPADDLGTRMDLLAEELADYQVRLTLGRISEFEVSLAVVEEEIEELYLGGEDEVSPEWELWGGSL